MKRFRGMAALVVTASCWALIPAAAQAADLSRHGQYGEDLWYRAGPGETNDVTITWREAAVTVHDPGTAQIDFTNSAASSTCRQTEDPHTVVCDVTSPSLGDRSRGGASSIGVGDGDDKAQVVAPPEMYSSATFSGAAGDDLLIGGPGNDRFYGGSGYDTYVGGAGHNILSYNDGDAPIEIDRRIPGVAPDGERIPDDIRTIEGTYRDDVLTGDGGDDELVGSGGHDTLRGEGGDDLLDAGRYNSASGGVLDGGSGDDLLSGGNEADSMDGGAGDDVMVGRDGPDDLAGGPGFDTVTYREEDTGPIHDRWPPPPGVVASIGDGPDDGSSYDGPEGARDDIHADVEGLRGSDQSDRLAGSDGPDVIDAGSGQDRVTGGGGDDTLITSVWPAPESVRVDGGSGDDDVMVQGPNVVADGGEGNDLLASGDGPARGTRIMGGGGDDKLFGGGWDLTLDAGAGDDLVAARDWMLESGTCGDGNDIGLLDPAGDPHGPTDSVSDCESVPPADPTESAAKVAFPVAGGSVEMGNYGGYISGEAAMRLVTPRAGPVVIEQLGHVDGPAPQPVAVPLQVDVRAPNLRSGDALRMTFVLLPDLIPTNVDVGAVNVYRDGLLVPDCVGDAPLPDPCVSSRKRIDSYSGDGLNKFTDAEIAVRSSAGGRWTFGRPESPAPPASPASPSAPANPGGGDLPAGDAPVTPGEQSRGDTTAPRLRIVGLRAPRLQALLSKGVGVPLTCSERCATTTQLMLATGDAKRAGLPVVIGRARASVSGRRSVRVKLSRGAARKLRGMRVVRLVVRATAVDAAGNESVPVNRALSAR